MPLLRLALAALLLSLPAPALAVTIDWLTVGDPGNAADSTGYGSVASVYRISETEVTNAQYAEFLNAVASADTHGLYNANMGSSSHGGITQTCTTGCSYATKAGMDDRPVNFVSFWDALRFANWLHNGQTANPASTESGAYTMTATGISNNTITRNAGAQIFLTSEDEWYKAAYYDAGSTAYFDYPIGSDTQTVCSALTTLPNSGNCANEVGTVTAVGAYTLSDGPEGTFDQAGNVTEWNEAIIETITRGIRGGDWFSNPANQAAGFRSSSDPTVEISTLGFRVASVPEPGTALLLAVGLVALGARRREDR